MKKTIKITESQLKRIVNNVLTEQTAPAVPEMAEATLDSYVDRAVDAIDGYVAASDLKELLAIVTDVAKHNFRGKNAMHEFLQSYEDDEKVKFLDDLNTIGVGTISGGGRMLRDIKSIVEKAVAAPVATPKPEVKDTQTAPSSGREQFNIGKPKTIDEFYKIPGLECVKNFPTDGNTLKVAKNGSPYLDMNLKDDMPIARLAIYYNGEVVIMPGNGYVEYSGKKLVASCGADGSLEINEKQTTNENYEKKKKLKEQLIKIKPEDTYTDTQASSDQNAANRASSGQNKTGETAEPKPETKGSTSGPNTATIKWQRILQSKGYDLGKNNPYGFGAGIDGVWGKKTQAAYLDYIAKKEQGQKAPDAVTTGEPKPEVKAADVPKTPDTVTAGEPKPEVKTPDIDQQRADAGGWLSDADKKAKEEKRAAEIQQELDTPGSKLFRANWNTKLNFRDPATRRVIVWNGEQLNPTDLGYLNQHMEKGGYIFQRFRNKGDGAGKYVWKKG